MICLAAGAVRTGAADKLLVEADIAVSVVVEGTLPGFTADQFAAYVTQQMAAAHIVAWRFATAKPDSPPSPNRIVWRFKVLPYAGGSIRYIGPIGSHFHDMFTAQRAIGVDARIYLNGQFQSTTFDQATIKGGPSDPDLPKVIERVLRSVVANAVSVGPTGDRHLAAMLRLKPDRRS